MKLDVERQREMSSHISEGERRVREERVGSFSRRFLYIVCSSSCIPDCFSSLIVIFPPPLLLCPFSFKNCFASLFFTLPDDGTHRSIEILQINLCLNTVFSIIEQTSQFFKTLIKLYILIKLR